MALAYATVRVDMALGGSYRQEVLADAPVGWWRFSERAGTVARDSSGFARNGTIAGGITMGVSSNNPESGGAFTFDGVSGSFINMGDVAAFEFASAFAVEFWIKVASNPAEIKRLVGKRSTPGWRVALTTGGKISFIGQNAANTAAAFLFETAAAVTDGLWHHVVCTWDGTTGANKAIIYLDGVSAATATSTDTALSTTNDNFTIASDSVGTSFVFGGSLDEVAVYNANLSSTRVATHYAAGAWTDITPDILVRPGIEMTHGINGNGPLDRTADAGHLSFWLRNDENNSARTVGYYSPQNANCRTGFRQGTLIRVVFTYNSVEYPAFMGKIVGIDPAAGKNLSRRVEVVANDLMADLVEADLRNVTLQVDQTEDSLIQTLMDAIPLGAQPLALDLDAGLDTSPFAFDKLGAGQKAYGPLNDIIISSIGFGYIGQDGIFRYENRQARQSSTSLFQFDSVNRIETPSTLEGVYNHVRGTVHPKTVDTAATTVLWSQTGNAPSLAAGESIDIWGTYFNPSFTTEKIGGTAQVAPAATTDYLANTLADGSGTNKTANITVTAEAFASTVKFTVTNNDAAAVFITKLQIRGKGLYDRSPVTVESFLTQVYGDRPLNIDLPYQSSLDVATSLVEYIRLQYENPTQQVNSFVFQANESETKLLAALSARIGNRMTLSEEVTGLTLAAVFVQSIRLKVYEKHLLECEFGVSSSSFFSQGFWVMDDADFSLAGNSTVFAYA